ncbi:MAG: hypothetical protein K6T83_13795 [Alicyclobacillus sp.]|nr:hypothetical protein [Alicyclobacillus sp.]
MGKYTKCFALGLQSAMEYRLNFLLGLVTVIVPIGIQYFLWTAVYSNSGKTLIYHYQYTQMIVYTIMAAICSRIVRTGFENDIASDIKNGGLSKLCNR